MPIRERPRSLDDGRGTAARQDVTGAGIASRADRAAGIRGEQTLESTPWSLTTERVGSDIVLRASGALDLDTAARLRAAATSALRLAGSAPTLVVDLSGITFLDSTGLGVLVTLWREARNAGGKFQVARPSAAATRILEISGVDSLFDLT